MIICLIGCWVNNFVKHVEYSMHDTNSAKSTSLKLTSFCHFTWLFWVGVENIVRDSIYVRPFAPGTY